MALFALPAAAEQQSPVVVVPDPGHGGRTPPDGAHGRRGPHAKASDAVTGILNDLALGQARNDSAALALIVQQHIVRGTRAPSRGVRQAPFLVLSGTRMPSALVEIGFISHPREGHMLGGKTYQGKVARALADGVRDFADKVLARRLVAQVRSPAEKPDGVPVNAASVASPGGTR